MTAKKKKKKEQKVEEEIVNLSGIEGFINKNLKYIAGGIGLLVLGVAGFLLLKNSTDGKQSKGAVAAMQAQQRFASQEWKNALEGTEDYAGFAEIASTYKGTAIGNMANYYAGICNYRLNEYTAAIDHLKKFKPTDDKNITGLAYLNLGDAYMQNSQLKEALAAYKKAAQTESEILQADFIIRYAKALIQVDAAGNKSEALAQFKKVLNNFAGSPQAIEAEQYVAALS